VTDHVTPSCTLEDSGEDKTRGPGPNAHDIGRGRQCAHLSPPMPMLATSAHGRAVPESFSLELCLLPSNARFSCRLRRSAAEAWPVGLN
jgi:hypothetical protein